MSVLSDAQEALADFVKANVTGVDPCRPEVPMKPVGSSAYVVPSEQWLSEPDEGTRSFCPTFEVGLMVDLVAGTKDMAQSQAWLADRLEELVLAAAGGVEVVPDQVIVPVSATRPQVMQTEGGPLFLVVSVEFSRFTLEAP